MSAEPIFPPSAPRLVPRPSEEPDSPGHRVPAVRISATVAAQVGRLTMDRGAEPPLMPEAQLLALLKALGDRYSKAREERWSGELEVTPRIHEGRHMGIRFNDGDRNL